MSSKSLLVRLTLPPDVFSSAVSLSCDVEIFIILPYENEEKSKNEKIKDILE